MKAIKFSKHILQKEAVHVINKESIDLAIVDVMLPDGSGFNLCKYS